MGMKHGRDAPFREDALIGFHGQPYIFPALLLCADAPVSEGVVQGFQEVFVGRGPAQLSSYDASDVPECVFQVSPPV